MGKLNGKKLAIGADEIIAAMFSQGGTATAEMMAGESEAPPPPPASTEDEYHPTAPAKERSSEGIKSQMPKSTNTQIKTGGIATKQRRIKQSKLIDADGQPPVTRRFYLPKSLDMALRHRLFMDNTKNLSEHVCAALKVYLAEDLRAIQEQDT